MTVVKDIDREAAASVAVLVEMRKLIRDGRADYHARAFARHREAAAKAERDRIVAWLRAMQEGRTSDNYPAYFALKIERGEHL